MLKKTLGQLGETIAASYLQAKGYHLVEKNFRTRHGEIDLVCKKSGELIFIEVKTRTNQLFGYPEEAITTTKLQKLENLAQIYCQRNDYAGLWRIEAVSILISSDQKKCNVKHLTSL